MAISREDLKRALDLARAGDWHAAHAIVQKDESDPLNCWLHACLHKMEGDACNARYWYKRSGGRSFEDFADAKEELAAILAGVAQQ